MNENLVGRFGFEPPKADASCKGCRTVVVELVATVALALSTLVAATVLTVGYARADTIGISDGDGGAFAVALFLGLLMAGMGGLTAVMTREPARRN